MATNNFARWVRNLDGATEPLTMLALFQAGATQAISAGELLEFTGDTNTAFVPLDSDYAMDGDVAIAAEEIKSGDRAGYYSVYVPRPGDVWEFDLATAAATPYGTVMTYSSSEVVTTGGSNTLGTAVGQEHYPDHQGHLADDVSGDAGTTIKTIGTVRMTIDLKASFYSTFVAIM